jgi:hydrogenase/urease accessory protein HupE
MRRWFTFVVVFVLQAMAPAVQGHEVRPGYLELRQTDTQTYAVLWKVPAVGEMSLSIHPRFPENCAPVGESSHYRAADSFTEHVSIACSGGLNGRMIGIDGIGGTITDVLVRIERLDGSEQVTRLSSSSPSFIVEAAPRRLEVARTYLALGVMHILTGIDHLLFVSGLLLLVTGVRRLLLTVSAFTLSHTVTLCLATLGFVHVRPAPVEAVIALSILFVALEVLRKNETPASLAQRKPWLVAFSFGLLHGLGFAGGLSAAGLPVGHIPLALGFFSAGVEVGHFSFVAVALILIAAVRQWTMKLPTWSWRLPPYAIGGISAYWLIVRLAAS